MNERPCPDPSPHPAPAEQAIPTPDPYYVWIPVKGDRVREDHLIPERDSPPVQTGKRMIQVLDLQRPGSFIFPMLRCFM